MPGSLPSARPIFLDEELRNGPYVTPTLLRKMIDWCRFTYARDLPYSPCDPLGRRTHDFVDSSSVGLEQAADQAYYVPFGSFYVPDPLCPARRLVIHLRCWGSSLDAAHPVQVLLTSNRGQSTVLTVDAPDVWQDFTWTCAPDSVVTIQARSPNGGISNSLQGICAYWEEPSALVAGATFSTTGTPIPAQSFPAQNRAHSVALARSMARWMNRFTARTTRMVVAKYHPGNGNAYEIFLSGAGPGAFVLKRYKVWISDNAETVTFRWDITTADAGASVKCEVVGGSSTTGLASVGTCDVAVTPGAGRVEELVVSYIPSAANWVYVRGVYAYEQAIDTAAIPAPSGETLFGSMPALERDSIRAESTLKASGSTGVLDVLKALQHLVATRERALVKDSGLVLDRTDGTAHPGAAAGFQSRGFPGRADIEGPTTIRVRAAAHGRVVGASLPASASIIVEGYDLVGSGPGSFWDGPFWAETRVRVSAVKAAVDNADAPAVQAAGAKVDAFPEWFVVDAANPTDRDKLSLVYLLSGTTDGLYEAEWTGCCIEQVVPEASVP